MLDIWTAKVDRCVITQAITKTTSVGFEHTIEMVSIFEMDLGWEKDMVNMNYCTKMYVKREEGILRHDVN